MVRARLLHLGVRPGGSRRGHRLLGHPRARAGGGSIQSSIEDAPPDADFRLLLCHRPEGHGPAADAGYDLTLSGHTHGGQVGLLGRSIFETLRPGIGWWGSYVKKKKDGRPSRLYTTSGFGHWFPFRFGCPTEMPIVVLEGARSGRIRTA